MKERPILFSAPMVLAILAGTKTQTRRVVKPKPERDAKWAGGYRWTRRPASITQPVAEQYAITAMPMACPYGQPGDRLWVRERLSYDSERGHFYAATEPGTLGNPSGRNYVDYDRETPANGLPARSIPSIHMPRWASRITLEVTGVRVERLQDISEADVLAEGWQGAGSNWRYPGRFDAAFGTAQEAFRYGWESINGPSSWDANPWVWAIEFRRFP